MRVVGERLDALRKGNCQARSGERLEQFDDVAESIASGASTTKLTASEGPNTARRCSNASN